MLPMRLTPTSTMPTQIASEIMTDPIQIDVSNLTLEQYKSAPKQIFVLIFDVKKHDNSNVNTIYHSKACDCVCYGIARVFVHTASPIDIRDAVRLISVKYMGGQFVVKAPEPLVLFAVGPKPIFFPVDVDETKAHYDLKAAPYTGPATAQEKREETIYKCVIIEPPQGTDSANTIADTFTNRAKQIGLTPTHIAEGFGVLQNPIGKHYVEFEITNPIQGFPLAELMNLKSFVCPSGSHYTVKWNEALCAKYNLCKVCLKSLSNADMIRCSCYMGEAGNWRMRKRARGTSTLDAAFTRAAGSFDRH